MNETRKATAQTGGPLNALHSKRAEAVAETRTARKSIDQARSQAEVLVNRTPLAEPLPKPVAAPAPATPEPLQTTEDDGSISQADINFLQHSLMSIEKIPMVVARTFCGRLIRDKDQTPEAVDR